MRQLISVKVFRFLLPILAGLGLAATPGRAAVVEWELVDPMLHAETTDALLRYYTVIEKDSLKVKYISTNSESRRYRLRAITTENDSLGRLLLLQLGQNQLFSTDRIRVALGEQLYQSLLSSHRFRGANPEEVQLGSQFSHQYFGRHAVTLSIDRIDVAPSEGLHLFGSIGARESNQFWWSDGSFRVGIAAPGIEVAAILPLAAGSRSIGPLRQRLLAPVYGGALSMSSSLAMAWVRASRVLSGSTAHSSNRDRTFYHSMSAGLGIDPLDVMAEESNFSALVGLTYEEYREIEPRNVGDETVLLHGGRIWHLWPMVEMYWESPDESLRIEAGTRDLALVGSLQLRLSRHLWVELSGVSNSTFRDAAPYEHPAYLFLTPRIRF